MSASDEKEGTTVEELFVVKFVKEANGEIKCRTDFPPKTDVITALALMGQAVVGLIATGGEMGKAAKLTDSQILSLMGLPEN